MKIWLVVLVVILSAIVILYWPKDPTPVAEPIRFVSVLATESRCAADLDCVVVPTSCNGCCETAAIAASFKAAVQSRVESCQKAYAGGVCRCASRNEIAFCHEKLCQVRIVDK